MLINVSDIAAAEGGDTSGNKDFNDGDALCLVLS